MDQSRPFDDQARGAGPPLYGDTAARSRAHQTGESEGIGSLITGLIADLQEIVRGEVRLAKAELKEDASQIGRGVGMLGAGVFFALVGFIFLMLAVTYLLNKSLEMWLSAGIVAAALLVLAVILALVGKNRLSVANLKPEQTIASLKEDQQWAKQQINSVKR